MHLYLTDNLFLREFFSVFFPHSLTSMLLPCPEIPFQPVKFSSQSTDNVMDPQLSLTIIIEWPDLTGIQKAT